MLQYDSTKPGIVVGRCDCGRLVEIPLAGAEPNKLGYFLNPPVICPCGAKHATMRLPDELLVDRNLTEKQIRQREEARRLEAVTKEDLARIMVLSVPAASGYEVCKHFDIVAAEVVLGTGFLSEWNAAFADFFGIQSSLMEEKLDAAKQAAIHKLRSKALLLGANAVLSVDVDYHSLTSNLLMVVATGTPVTLQSAVNSK